MAQEEAVEAMARVLETLPAAIFRVELDAQTFQTHPTGRPDPDELSSYDLNRGRITYRYK